MPLTRHLNCAILYICRLPLSRNSIANYGSIAVPFEQLLLSGQGLYPRLGLWSTNTGYWLGAGTERSNYLLCCTSTTPSYEIQNMVQAS